MPRKEKNGNIENAQLKPQMVEKSRKQKDAVPKKRIPNSVTADLFVLIN